ncbi:MAG: type 1 glutamine amidotransferase domain-containing protein [Luteimonas sp.]
MPAFRFLLALLLFVLSPWPCGTSKAHAAETVAARTSVDSALTTASTTSAHTVPSTAHTDINAPARRDQSRILFILASARAHGTSTIPASISFGEVVHAWDTFHAAGYAVDFVTPDGGDVPILDAYVDDDLAPRLEDARIMRGLRNTATPAQIDPDLYRAVYYVGGSNAMYGVPEHPVLQRIATHVYERNGGVISAVCHGTAGIAHIRLANGRYLVAGKRISGYPEEHEDQDADYFKQFPFLIRQTVEARGGSFHMVDSPAPYLEVDGRVVTGQNYASAAPVAEAVVEVLRGLATQSPRADTAQR